MSQKYIGSGMRKYHGFAAPSVIV